MKNKRPFIVHVIFWLLIGLILTIQVIFNRRSFSLQELAIIYGYSGLVNISIFYINYTLLIPLLVKEQKRYGLYIVSIVLLILVMCIIKTIIASLNAEVILSYTS